MLSTIMSLSLVLLLGGVRGDGGAAGKVCFCPNWGYSNFNCTIGECRSPPASTVCTATAATQKMVGLP